MTDIPRVKIKLIKDYRHTKIVNARKIADALKTSPFFLVKYIAEELFTPISRVDLFTVEGAYDEKKIQKKLDKFVKQFITCDDCGSTIEIMVMNDDTVLKGCQRCLKLNTIRRKHVWLKRC